MRMLIPGITIRSMQVAKTLVLFLFICMNSISSFAADLVINSGDSGTPPGDSTPPPGDAVSTPTHYTTLGKPMRYVRFDATGSGTGLNWADAYTSLPATLVRDSVYFIADGNYGRYTFNDAVSGDSNIYIVKATANDHGTDNGWNASYGDGQALFASASGDTLNISTDHWVIDGKTRSGWDSGYGFKFSNTTPTSVETVKLVRLANGVSNVIVKFCDMQHRGDGLARHGDDIFYAPGSRSNIAISRCYLHDASRNGILMIGENHIFEESLMERIKGTGGTHGQGLQIFGSTSDFTIRNNIFKDINGTATIACAWGTDGLYVYGNVFYKATSGYQTNTNTIVNISNGDETGLTNAKIFNNTFYQYDGATGGHQGVTINITSDSSTNRIYNNLFINCDEVMLESSDATHDYNHFVNSTLAYGTSANNNDSEYTEAATIIGAQQFNFNLSAGKGPINSGTPLDASFGVDPDGTTRGQDGQWDVGAYER